MPPSFSFLDLRCFADPSDARSYYFLPVTPGLRRDARQQPMITLLDLAASGNLMFTATWSAESGSVEALRREIAKGHHESDVSRIRLSFAALSSLECHALLGDGTGSFQTVATSQTSGVPPYDALFNLSLTTDHLTRVRNAMRGDQGFLAIEYVADLLVPFTAAATFRSEIAHLAPWLRTRTGGGSIRTLLEEAVEAGVATVTIDAPDSPGEDIAIELFNRVISQAAQVAPRLAAEDGAGDIDVHVTLERSARERVRAFADIGGIVAGGSVRPS
jgi:hypothetical protein